MATIVVVSFLRNRLLRRFGPAGRLADAALVGGAALKYAQRKGWVTDETARKLGASDSAAGADLSIGEMLLLAAAVWRLVRQLLRRPDERIVIEV